MKNSELALCVIILVAGCGSQSYSYSLGPQVEVNSTENQYYVNGTVSLGGRPASSLAVQGVKVQFVENESVVATQQLGTFTVDNSSKRFNVTLQDPPDKVLVRYDSIQNEGNREKNVFGMRNFDGTKYTSYRNYSVEY